MLPDVRDRLRGHLWDDYEGPAVQPAPSVSALTEDERIAASWGRDGGDVIYTIVEDVDLAVLEGAVAGSRFASAHLGVPKPFGRFFRKESALRQSYRTRYGGADWPAFRQTPVLGLADRATYSIGVCADVDAFDAATIGAHEVLHVGRPSASEEEAKAYGKWAAELLVRQGRVAEVFRVDHYPYTGVTFKGEADEWDVVVAHYHGEVGVFKNFGTLAHPEWRPHHARCPVDAERRAA